MLSKVSLIRIMLLCAVVAAGMLSASVSVLLESKNQIFTQALEPAVKPELIEPFPVGVDPLSKVIVEDPQVNEFFTETLASASNSSHRWWNKAAAVFAHKSWYQNLASPVSRIVVIWPGERKEEVAHHIGNILRWDTADKELFVSLITNTDPALAEGKFYPGQYVTHRQASPEEMAQLITAEFTTEILERYTDEVAAQVSLDDALIIASLLEREASDFYNMREVSGVIWNRLFIDMPLQLDASLQYIRGGSKYESQWWPKVVPADKFLESDFNTYQNPGLPPAPIANPSAEAVLAALNPIVTDCLYYFHTDSGEYYCSADYAGHVKKLQALYGQGK